MIGTADPVGYALEAERPPAEDWRVSCSGVISVVRFCRVQRGQQLIRPLLDAPKRPLYLTCDFVRGQRSDVFDLPYFNSLPSGFKPLFTEAAVFGFHEDKHVTYPHESSCCRLPARCRIAVETILRQNFGRVRRNWSVSVQSRRDAA